MINSNTKSYFICDHCHEPIIEPGILIRGNMGISNPDDLNVFKGFIENAFPKSFESNTTEYFIDINKIKVYAYHWDCLADYIEENLNSKK